MVGPFRCLTSLLIFGAIPQASLFAQDPAVKPDAGAGGKPAAADFALPGEEPPKAFVPARPRTVEEQRHVEALRYYAVARAQEERHQYADAIASLEKALVSEPESTPVLRRLGRLNFALGREEKAIALSRRVIAADPGDIETVALMVNNLKVDQAGLEILLRSAEQNPRLEKNTGGAIYLQLELGNLYELTLRMEKAAEAFGHVVDALDERSGARLSQSELNRLLAPDEKLAYLRFGQVFLIAGKLDRAIKAFRRGLVYDDNHPLLLLYLAEAYQRSARPAEALPMLEKFLLNQPSGRQTYDQLIKLLVELKREAEIIPRLEKYAQADQKNTGLLNVLIERYKAAGQVEKANFLFKKMLAEQRDTQDFPETFPRLLKEKKTEELIALTVRVVGRLKRLDIVKNQIEELIKDPVYTDEFLDTGLKMINAKPPAVDPNDAWFLLINVANEGKRLEKMADLYRWNLKRNPNPIEYRGLIETLREINKFAEAEAVYHELLDKFPDERSARNLVLLADIQGKADHIEPGIATAREALVLDPTDPAAVRVLALLLNQAGKVDEAIESVRGPLKIDAANPMLNFTLANLLAQANKNDEAIALLKGAIDKFPNNEDLVKIARSTLSNIYTALGDFAKGEAELEILLAKEPEDPGINNDLGYLYADQGKNLEKAESMIRKALKEDPENFAYQDSLGWVLFKRGKLDEAKTYLEQANGNTQADSTIPDHLGDVYFQLQEPAKAKSSWERALQMASQAKPVDKRVPEIRKKINSLQYFQPAARPSKSDRP